MKSHSYARRTHLWLALAAVAILAGGCLSKPSLKTQAFAFSLPPLSGEAQQAQHVLELRRLKVAAPFASQSFVYRTGPYSYEQDPYAGFLVPPDEALLAPLRGYLRDSGFFTAVVSPGSSLSPDTSVEVYVSELYGDFRNRAAPRAVLRMTFRLFAMRNGLPGKLLFEKEYAQAVPFRTRTAAALMAGWNQALERILADLVADLRNVRQLTPPNGHHTSLNQSPLQGVLLKPC